MCSYNDRDLREKSLNEAQNRANTHAIRLIHGYDSNTGWTVVKAIDESTAAELVDITLVTPRITEPELKAAIDFYENDADYLFIQVEFYKKRGQPADGWVAEKVNDSAKNSRSLANDLRANM